MSQYGLIRRNLKELAFLLWYRPNEFLVIRLQSIKQLSKMMKNVHLACNVTLDVQLDHGAPLELVDNVH